MRRSSLSRLASVLLLAAAPAVCRAQGWQTDFEAARAEAQKTNRPLLVHFWAEWCGPCMQMDKAVLNTSEVLGELQRGVVGIRVNADQHQDLCARFGVEQLPMDILLEPGGERLLESTGYRPVSEYLEMLRRGQTRLVELDKRKAQQAQIAKQAPTPKAGDVTHLLGDVQKLPMIDGYCPVTLWENRKWVKGSSEFQSEFRSQFYQFASAEAKKVFEENPRRFTPRFLGCDPVIVWESDKAVRGTTKFGAFYDNELYLFTSAENRDRFKETPDRYIRTRIVLRPEHIESVTR